MVSPLVYRAVSPPTRYHLPLTAIFRKGCRYPIHLHERTLGQQDYRQAMRTHFLT